MNYENIFYNSKIMNQIINIIIEKNIKEYITKISEKYKLDDIELNNIWNDIQKNEQKKPIYKKVISKKEKIICSYVFTKGNRLNEICDFKTKDNSLFCTKHKKYEDLETKKVKQIIPSDNIDKIINEDTNIVNEIYEHKKEIKDLPTLLEFCKLSQPKINI